MSSRFWRTLTVSVILVGQSCLPVCLADESTNSEPSSTTSSAAPAQPASQETQPSASTSEGTRTEGTAPQSDVTKKESNSESTQKTTHLSPNVVRASASGASPIASTKKITLYGRIEQIASNKVEFPILKAEVGKLDPRGPLQGRASEAMLSGSIVNQYPSDYKGVWGGSLALWSIQEEPTYWQIDPDAAKWNRAAYQPGVVGQVNFRFGTDTNGKMTLEPARVAFLIPMKDTSGMEQVNQLMGSGAMGQAFTPNGNSTAMNGMMQSVMTNLAASVKVPVFLMLGNFETTGLLRGLSGNEMRGRVLKNSLRQLAPGILEQQIVVGSTERNAKTGQVRQGYEESVVRFTKQSTDQFYVLLAVATYTTNRQLEWKMILNGTVRRGQVVQDNPSVYDGMGDMKGLGNLLNGPGGFKLPQLPQGSGGGENPFQGLFPQ